MQTRKPGEPKDQQYDQGSGLRSYHHQLSYRDEFGFRNSHRQARFHPVGSLKLLEKAKHSEAHPGAHGLGFAKAQG